MEQDIILVFNKESGKYLFQMNKLAVRGELKTDYYSYKEATFDESTHEWVGDITTGSIVEKQSEEDQPMYINESQIDGLAKKKIIKEYPEYSQLNILMKTMITIVEELKLTGDERISEFEEMVEYIDHIRENNQRYKEAYEKSPYYDYHSYEDIKNESQEEIAGGLRQVIPKTSDLNEKSFYGE